MMAKKINKQSTLTVKGYCPTILTINIDNNVSYNETLDQRAKLKAPVFLLFVGACLLSSSPGCNIAAGQGGAPLVGFAILQQQAVVFVHLVLHQPSGAWRGGDT